MPAAFLEGILQQEGDDADIHADSTARVPAFLEDIFFLGDENDDEVFAGLEEQRRHVSSALDKIKAIRGGATSPVAAQHYHHRSKYSQLAFAVELPKPLPSSSMPLPPPAPPKEVPVRFLRAAKGDPVAGRERYQDTLDWRKKHRMDYVLSEPHPHFEFIKQHYPHYFHLRGKNNEPVYYESPPKTDLKALREGGVTLDILLRHYAMVTDYMWQWVEPSDEAQSIYIIDLEGIKVTDFVGECVTFVRKACNFCNRHYPERSGCIMVINVPSWFNAIWKVVKRFADKKTLGKVSILHGKEQVLEALSEKIPLENIPPEYGGTSVPLGQAPEEIMLCKLMKHNNDRERYGIEKCGGREGGCPFCSFVPVRSY